MNLCLRYYLRFKAFDTKTCTVYNGIFVTLFIVWFEVTNVSRPLKPFIICIDCNTDDEINNNLLTII